MRQSIPGIITGALCLLLHIGLFLMFSPLPVRGQDQPIVYAFADISCGAWVKSKGDRVAREVYRYWFRGFVSGYNFGNPYNQVFMMPNAETLDLYVDNYCKEKPLDAFISAAFKLVEELTKNASSEKTRPR